MKRRIGREAIELIKDYYENGDGTFGTAYQIADWLRTHHRIRATYHQAQEWDRTARLERADKLQSTTTPSARNGFARQAAPAHAERTRSRSSRLKDTTTRVANDVREAKADAAQPDADAIERARVALLENAQHLIGAANGLA
jgi:hypothetical protein